MANESQNHCTIDGIIPRQRTGGSTAASEDHLLDHMLDGFALCEIICDDSGKPVDYRHLRVNRAFEENTGFSREAVLGKTARELFPGMESLWIETFGRVALENTGERFEAWFGPLDRHFEVSAYCPEKGRFISIFRDITERRAEVQRLRQLSHAVESSPAAVVITDRAGNIEYVNPKFTEVSGYTSEEVLGKNSRVLKSGEFTADDYKKLWETITAGDVWRGEFHNRKKNGELYWESASISPIRSEDGAITHFVAVKEDITRAKEFAEQLLRSEREHRHLLERLNAGVIVHAPDTSVVFCNDQATWLLGLPREEIIGRLCDGRSWNFYHEDGTPMLPADYPVARVIASGQPVENLTFGVRRPNSGDWVWIMASAFPEFENNGALKRVVVTFANISVQKLAVEALRKSEARFRTICEASPLGIVLTDEHGGTIYANNMQVKISGRSMEELADRGWVDAIAPEDRATVQKEWEEAARTHSSFQSVRRYMHRDGNVVWAHISAAPILDRDILRGFVGMVQDITDQRKAMVSLRQSEERFRQLAENVHGVFWMSSLADGKILYVSPAYQQIWGRSCKSLYENPASWIEAIHPEDRARVREKFLARNERTSYDETYRIIRPDGSMRWIRDYAFQIREDGESNSRVAGIAEDITERKRLDDQFLRAQRMESIGTLASGVAHDLNNILAPIMMSAEMLREDISPENRTSMLEMIENSARRGADIVNQVLTFARGVDGERSLLQVRHLVRDLEKIMRETFPKSITVTNRMPRDLWPVHGDSTQIHQVLLNLCINARDAMPQGGALTIAGGNVELNEEQASQIPDARPGSYSVIEARDTGTGIPPDIIGKIFDPFFTTKEVGKGTGLGLSTLIGIVKSHDGFVTVTSKLGSGTTFKVFLPAARDQSAAGDAEAKPELMPGAGETILIADDETHIRTATSDVLKKHGYDVLVAANGIEAMSLYVRHASGVKAVLTDVMMPLLDGVDLTRALKKMAPALPVIASTGQADEVRQAELRSLGVKVFLQKPYSIEKLLRTLHESLHPA